MKCGQRMELVLPFTPDELERAIVGPAERVGAEWEPGLVADIMHDVGDQPGALPLLQYALTGLFEKRDGRRVHPRRLSGHRRRARRAGPPCGRGVFTSSG